MEEREEWREQIEQSKRMRQWVLDAEHILDGSWVPKEEHNETSQQVATSPVLTNEEVGLRFDRFRLDLTQKLTEGVLTQTERECLVQFLQVLDSLRPHLIQCYNLPSFPRTNNETEGSSALGQSEVSTHKWKKELEQLFASFRTEYHLL